MLGGGATSPSSLSEKSTSFRKLAILGDRDRLAMALEELTCRDGTCWEGTDRGSSGNGVGSSQDMSSMRLDAGGCGKSWGWHKSSPKKRES